MRFLIPQTPSMRYERMLVAGIAAVASIAIGMVFFGMAVDSSSSLSIAQLFTEPTMWRQAASIGMLSGGCLSLGISFALSFLIKVQFPEWERYIKIYLLGRRMALCMLVLACFFGFGFAMLQFVFVIR